jgi:hypothetical protein
MTNEVLGLILLGCMFVVILGGFPISFTLILLGLVFGYIGTGERVFHLMTFQVFDGDLANAPARLRHFLESVGVATEFSAYGVDDDESRRMVAQALDGVRGRNFIGARS